MEQLYYTACPIGYGQGSASGYQVKRISAGYPVPGDLRALTYRPFLPGASVLAPAALRYWHEGEAAHLAWLTPRATEYETERGGWGRPGGYFAHSLCVEPVELEALASWPAGLHDRPFWCRSDPGPSRKEPPPDLALGADDLMLPPRFSSVRVLREAGETVDRLARLLTALAEVVRFGRTLFLIEAPERLVRRIALLTFAFPESMRLDVTFSTYHDAPSELPGFRLQGTIPAARLKRPEMRAQGIVADLRKTTIEPPIDPALWAITLADWLVKGSTLDQGHWTAFNRLARPEGSVSSLHDRWADDRLDELVTTALDEAEPEPAAESARSKPAPRTVESQPRSAPGGPRPGTGAGAGASPGSNRAESAPSAIAVGIDLGTTYSVVATLDPQGRPVSIVNAHGDLLTPSVVLFDDDGVVVGKEAVAASVLEPERVAECVKRDMGARAFRKPINGKSMPPEVISSMILRQLKSDAERRLGPIERAVITVPAYFDEPRRRATADAGRLAGLEVLDIINEPTAAALAYAYQIGLFDRQGEWREDSPFKALVYDLGGGTFDITVVELQKGSFRALATDGDFYLGGKDWDAKLVEIAAERFRQARGSDPREDLLSLQELTLSAEAAKKTLSERARAMMVINHQGERLKLEITREEFEEATAPLLERTRATTEIVGLQAGLSWREIDRIMLVGGSTRMPMVSRMLQELTGKTPDGSLAADEAVAHGAALYAGLLLQKAHSAGSRLDFAITNVNSHSLGLVAIDPQTRRRTNQILIPKNTPLPHSVTRQFRTLKEGQQSVKLTLLEGESELPEACTQIGIGIIRGFPPGLRRGWPVEVTYTYQPNNRLRVIGKLVGHDAAVTTVFERANDLSEDEFAFWIECLAERVHRPRELSDLREPGSASAVASPP